jgi:hypothetical protein
MKKIIDFGALATLTLSLCLAGTAYAANDEPVAECSGIRNAQFYSLGYIKGVSLVNQAWNSLGTFPEVCDHDLIPEFVGIVINAFEAGRPAPGSLLAVYCHWAGSLDGSAERANELIADCDDYCNESGYMIGEMAAIFYCQLSIAFDGLGHDEWLVRIDPSYCGELFEGACEDRFDDVTYNYPSGIDPQCREYTESPFSVPPDLGVYEETRYNQCSYAIVEP